MSIVYDQLASDYLEQFNRPLSVPAMAKLEQFSFIQKLNYGLLVGDMKSDFHGLQDFQTQMTLYSNSQPILKAAWGLIKNIVPFNIQVAKTTYLDPDLGQVGLIFQTIPGFAKIFSLSQDDLSSSDTLNSKVTISSDQLSNLQGS